MYSTKQLCKMMFRISPPLPFLLAMVAFAPFPFPLYGQDWPSTVGSTQAEFEISREQTTAEAAVEAKVVSRGRLESTSPSRTANFNQLLRREVINPFEDTAIRSSAPLVQTLPEEVNIPEIPTVLIYEQINLDEFRNYLRSLIADPPVESKPNYSNEDIKTALNKISISALVVRPIAYVAINGNKFREGDRFSLAMPPVQTHSNIETLIEAQMPDKNDVSEEVYQKFETIKNEALLQYHQRQQERIAQTGANKHNISVIVKKIAHRNLVVSVNGKDYAIPIRLAL